MILLDKAKYELLTEPVTKLKINHLFALSVLKQHCNGEVFVDNSENPSSFFVKHQYGMSLLFGESNNDKFNSALVAYIKNENGERSSEEYLQVDPEKWGGKFTEMIQENGMSKHIEEFTRVNFKFNEETYKKLRAETELPIKNLTRTRSELFSQIYGTVVPQNFWVDATMFFSKGIGYTMARRGELVSTAFAAYFHDNQLELGIETADKYQGKGYGVFTCVAVIDYCLKHGFEPVWACRQDNIGSMKLAQKLGFEPTITLPFYHIS